MADLTSLYKQRAALDAEIKATREAAAKAGEIIVIDGKEYDSTLDFEGSLPNPAKTDYIPTYRKDDNGDITDAGEITYGDLVGDFAQEATAKVQEAINAGNTAVQNIESAETAALQAIGQTDDAGARKAALDAINSAKTAALSAIGQTDSEGARKAALDAISAARTAALSAIGDSNTTGARGEAIAAINELYDQIEAAIEQANTVIDQKVETATGAASAAAASASNASSSETNAASSASAAATSATNAASSESNAETYKNQAQSAKTDAESAKADAESAKSAAETAKTGAETAEGNAESSASEAASSATAAAGSATNAATSETNAANSEALAEKWAENPEDSPVEGTGDNAKFSAKHWAAKAQANSNVPMATDTTAGKVYISNTAEISDGEANLANKTVSKQALSAALNNITNNMALPTPIIWAKFIEGDDEVQMDINNDYSGYGNVVVRYATNAEPTASSPEATFPMSGSGNDVYYFAAFPGTGSTNKKSANAVIDMADFKVATPTYTFDDATDTISFVCSTYGATMRLTTNGTEPSATNGELYTAPISLTAVTSFKVKGIRDGFALSDTLSVTINKVATPTFTFSKEAETVAITCSTADAIIKYTTDGSIPSETHGTTYVGAIPVTDTTTFQIKAFKAGWIDSEQVTGKAVFAQIIAVRRPITMTGTAWTRLTPETDPLSVVTETITVEPTGEITGTRTGQSVFDAYAPWQTKMRNFENDGTPGAWQDEAGFTLTDKDVMVYFPKCWIKLTVDTNYITKYISTDEYDGFVYAPWSEEYLARYETSNNNQSRSGKTVQASQSIVTMRTNARAKGAGWQLYDLPAWHAMQWLFVVEYKDYDCQTLIGKGISSGSAQTTGKTDSMQFHTGRVAGTDGNTAVQYRYIENPWGNYWEWLDGYNEISRVPYVCWDRDNYQSDVTTGYTKIYDGWSSNIYGQGIKSTIINEDMPWCDGIPKEKGGSDTTYIPDYMDVGNSGNHVARVSGDWNYGSSCGLWCFNAYSTSGDTYGDTGSRLSYKEPSAA